MGAVTHTHSFRQMHRHVGMMLNQCGNSELSEEPGVILNTIKHRFG